MPSLHYSHLGPMDPLDQALDDAAPTSDSAASDHGAPGGRIVRRRWRSKKAARKNRNKDATLDALHAISASSALLNKEVISSFQIFRSKHELFTSENG